MLFSEQLRTSTPINYCLQTLACLFHISLKFTHIYVSGRLLYLVAFTIYMYLYVSKGIVCTYTLLHDSVHIKCFDVLDSGYNRLHAFCTE